MLPGSKRFNALRLLENPRFDATARPLALLRVASSTDVAAGLAFAQQHDLPVAVRSGGHSYAGVSGGGETGTSPQALVIDVRPLDRITLNGTRAAVGTGAQLQDVYAAIGGAGRAIAAGSCPTVGVAGLTLGGGVGVLTRAYGLTCDALTSAEVVLADGRVVTASATSEPDLFWALRGGGGHLGVATSFTVDTVPAPTMTTTYLTWPGKTALAAIPAWFDWMGSADARLWSTLKVLAGASHPGGATLGVTVTWVGASGDFGKQLAPFLTSLPTPSGRYDHVRGYLDQMRAYAGSGERESFAATSNVAYAPLPQSGLETLFSLVADAPHTLTEAGVSIDALGGHVGDLAPADTAFVHRKALATVQYTATYPTGDSPDAAQRYVGDLRDRMTLSWGDHAYVNYLDPTLANPGTAYFGDNWPRLQPVRKAYDPDGVFA